MDSDDWDDPDLKAAIEASLEDQNGPARNPNPAPTGQDQGVVDLTGDSDDDPVQIFPKSNSVVGSETDAEEGNDAGGNGDEDEWEDEDLKKAIELSMQGQREDEEAGEAKSQQVSSENSHQQSSTKVEGEPTSQPSKTTGILGLDRKQMEQERLARAAKRKASDLTPSNLPDPKHLRTSPQTLPTNTTSTLTSAQPNPTDIRQSRNEQTTMPSIVPTLQFPSGAVKKTWAFPHPRIGDDIKIEEVLQKSDLELAVLSSFMWDMEWLFSKIDTRRTRFLLVMQAKEEATKRQYESETASMKNLRLCFPPMDGQDNCMHSKLMLLFHPGYVRIVVPTANLTPYDWGEERGVMENSVFLIDLPKISDTSSGSKTAFYDDLVYFLKASTLNENIILKLDAFDFSRTKHIAFVHTIGGAHTGESWQRTGYCGLGRAVDSLGLRTSKHINIDYVTSSLGFLNNDFLRSIYLAAQGDTGLTELHTRKSHPPIDTSRIRVYFPTESTVNSSKGGPNCAGTICFQERWFDGEKFPREVLRDCVSRRRGVLMHNKIIYVRPDEPIPLQDNAHCRGWAYIGSANLSESAWGRLSTSRTSKSPKLTARNYECGILMPVIDPTPDLSIVTNANDIPEGNMLDVFQGTVPVPMETGRGMDGERPWFFSKFFG